VLDGASGPGGGGRGSAGLGVVEDKAVLDRGDYRDGARPGGGGRGNDQGGAGPGVVEVGAVINNRWGDAPRGRRVSSTSGSNDVDMKICGRGGGRGHVWGTKCPNFCWPPSCR
jgi:hypothetical protein